MYLSPQFAGSPDQARALMQAHPFASLISTDDSGLPFVTHLPLVLELADSKPSDLAASAAPSWQLLGHVAKPNPHWRYLQARPRAVVTFLGPHGYMSPSVYPDLARVPTWNYLAVHCTVECVLIDEEAAKDALLKKLIGEHEPAYAQQWRDLGPAFAQKMLAGIVAFSLKITSLQCKVKLNQHRPEAHAAMQAQASALADGQGKELARWMAEVLPQPAGNQSA